MISFSNESIFNINSEAIVIPINLAGTMASGLSLECSLRYKGLYEAYLNELKKNNINIGTMFLFKTDDYLIINFPIQITFKYPPRLSYIEKGLNDLIKIINNKKIKSINLPPLGVGLGLLSYDNVISLYHKKLDNIASLVNVCLNKEPAKGLEKRLIEIFNTIDFDKANNYLEFQEKTIEYLKSKQNNLNRFYDLLNEKLVLRSYKKIYLYCLNYKKESYEQLLLF